MEKNEDGETSFLLEERDNDSLIGSSSGRKTKPTTTERSDLLNLKESFLILVGLSFGTGVLVIPYTVRELGATTFVILLIVTAIFLCFCSQLLNKSVVLLICDSETPELIRDPYPAAAELAGGTIFRKALTRFMYVGTIFGCISSVLLVSTILKDLIYIGDFSHNNLIRIWSAIIVSLITPLMLLGTYSDMRIPTIVALATSTISVIAVIINCFIANYVYGLKPDPNHSEVQAKGGQILLSLGSIVFVTSGSAVAIPTVLVISANPKKLGVSIVATFIALFFLYLSSGLIPFFTLGEHVMPSITSTFHAVTRIKKVGLTFKALTVTIQVLMMVHLLMVSIMIPNPCYLHMEEYFNVPHEMNMKRVVIRSGFMLTILVICCVIPQFNFMMGVGGGVPYTAIGIIFPLIIYAKLFDPPVSQKIILAVLLIASSGFIISNLVFSVIDLFHL